MYYLEPEYQAFLGAVLASPDDNMPRLTLADWLEERALSRGPALRKATERNQGLTTTHNYGFHIWWERGFVVNYSEPETLINYSHEHMFLLRLCIEFGLRPANSLSDWADAIIAHPKEHPLTILLLEGVSL